jgi:uncharacterized membrane protein
VRRLLAAAALLALVALHLDYRLIAFPFVDRAAFHRGFMRLPDGTWPQFPAFLAGVRAHTKAGDTIAVAVPNMSWEGGYSYAYYRASYYLAGREVLPLVYRTDAPIRGNLAQARYFAAWRVPTPNAPRVWEGHGGVLLRR